MLTNEISTTNNYMHDILCCEYVLKNTNLKSIWLCNLFSVWYLCNLSAWGQFGCEVYVDSFILALVPHAGASWILIVLENKICPESQ